MTYHGEGILAVDIMSARGKLLVGEAVHSHAELILLLSQTSDVGIVGRVEANGSGTET